ncbi:MAG: DUF6686 family protein [Bacteroidota bacterium]
MKKKFEDMLHHHGHLPEGKYDENLPYQLLFRDGQDKILYCQCCKAFHFYFGNLAIDLKETGMHAFRKDLNYYYEKYQGCMCGDCRCIEVPTPCRGIRLNFSLIELKEMIDRIDSSLMAFNESYWKPRLN